MPDSLRAQKHGKSSMERLMDACEPVAPNSMPYIMLEEQFRMAPPLRAVVSSLYYYNRLKDGPNVLNHGPMWT